MDEGEHREVEGGRSCWLSAESVVVAPGPGFYGTEGAGTTEIRLAAVLDEYRIRRATQILAWALEAYPGRT